MAIPFHDLTVASFLRTLDATSAVLEKASAHCVHNGMDREAIVEASLHPTMKPLRYQIRSVAHHSIGAIDGLRRGTFSPPVPAPSYSFAQLQAMMVETREQLTQVTPDEAERLATGEVEFVAGERRARFTAQDFVLSFSLPNFYFHATTAYDILRHNGVPLEKRDYLGNVIAKHAPQAPA